MLKYNNNVHRLERFSIISTAYNSVMDFCWYVVPLYNKSLFPIYIWEIIWWRTRAIRAIQI